MGLTPLLGASRVFTAAVAHSLTSAGGELTAPQLRVLVMIAHEGPLDLKTVAERLGVNPSNASRTCHRLVVAGLLSRREQESDRRYRSLTLTDAGSQVVDTVMARRRGILRQVLQRMTPVDRSTLLEGLTAFTVAAGQAAEAGELDGDLGDAEAELLRWLA